MSRGIVLVGNESSLLSALCAEAGKQVEKYALAYIPPGHDRKTIQYSSIEDRSLADRQYIFDWNPASPVSAKTLVLSALNKLGNIDEAVLVCVPPAYRKNADAFTADEIDHFFDCNIKGWFFLVRELAVFFTERKRGTLALVLPEINTGSGVDAPDLCGPVAAASFRSFAQGIMLSSVNTPYETLGFSVPQPGGDQAFAAYVFKTMEEEKRNSGRWYKFGKFGLFNR